jgi:putative tricarboxylic transport membrane protein
LSVAAVALLFGLGFVPTAARADFPDKPITLVVASDPGSGSDITARLVAAIVDKYKILPQPIVVENKPGGSMCVATGYVAGKDGDPYYLMAATVTQLINPLRGQCPISWKDMTPVANLSFDDDLIVVRDDSKFKSLDDLVAAAKGAPESVAFGGHMTGSIDSMETRLLEDAAGIKLKFVSFGGSGSGGDPMTSLLGGHVDVIMAQPMEALELSRAHKIRILGALTDKRLANLPDVPTVKEQGIDVTGIGLNRGILAAKNIPDDARKVLEDAFKKVSETEEYKKFHADNALSEGYLNGADYEAWMAQRSEMLASVLKDLGLEVKQ